MTTIYLSIAWHIQYLQPSVFYKVIMEKSPKTELSSIYDGLKKVQRKLRHSQSQLSKEHANQDIEDLFLTWLQFNSTTHWLVIYGFFWIMKRELLTRISDARLTNYCSWKRKSNFENLAAFKMTRFARWKFPQVKVGIIKASVSGG